TVVALSGSELVTRMWRLAHSARSGQNSTAQADGFVQKRRRATCSAILFMYSPIGGRKGHLPEKRRWREEFYGDLRFSVFHGAAVHHATGDLFSGTEI